MLRKGKGNALHHFKIRFTQGLVDVAAHSEVVLIVFVHLSRRHKSKRRAHPSRACHRSLCCAFSVSGGQPACDDTFIVLFFLLACVVRSFWDFMKAMPTHAASFHLAGVWAVVYKATRVRAQSTP